MTFLRLALEARCLVRARILQRRCVGVLAAALIGLLSSSALASASAPGFTYTDTTSGCQAYTVPAGITTVTITATGGAGTAGTYAQSPVSGGGTGGNVSGQLAVPAGQALYLCVDVGGAGTSGNPGNAGGNGGGASGIALGSDFSDPLVVAGGGGGGGTGGNGGNAGSPVAQPGSDPNYPGASGGGGNNTIATGGSGGTSNLVLVPPGNGGASSAAGPGGGGRGVGGGGGGGAGYFGGGGGADPGAGGGGSDFCADPVGGCQTGLAAAGPGVTIAHLAAQTITFPSTSVPYGHADLSPASSDSGLTPTYSAASGQCSLASSGLVHITGAGSCTVTANQAGNSAYAAASPVTQTFTITQATQTISFPTTAVTYGHANFSPASTTSSLAISYTAASGQCSIASSGLVDITGAGSCTVTASQPGNANYGTATAVTQTFTIDPATVHVDADAILRRDVQPTSSPTYTLRAGDFVNGETASSAAVTGSGTCQIADHSQDVGTYPGVITCAPGTLAAANYVFVAGNAADLTITGCRTGTSLTATAFGYTGYEQCFVVPARVTSVSILANGGSSEYFGTQKRGASVAATVQVTPGSTLYVEVGGSIVQNSSTPSGNPGGWNGGGEGGTGSGQSAAYGGGSGGGGASDVRTCSVTDSSCILSAGTGDPRLIVAGGAGGTGGTFGAEAGASATGAGQGSDGASAAGLGGVGSGGGAGGGSGTTAGANGTAVSGGAGVNGAGRGQCGGGGGGGGGYVGGGGGGCGGGSGVGGGGGGGSSFGPSNATISTASGSASVSITAAAPRDADLALGTHADITANATRPAGAVVNYTSPTATDEDLSTVSVSCLPASGSTFAVGDTTVNCTALDSDRDANSGMQTSFNVHAEGVTEQVASLGAAVAGIGSGSSLKDKVTSIQMLLASDQITAACGTLGALINQVKAQTGKSISSTTAASLTAAAQRIEAVASCAAVSERSLRTGRPAVHAAKLLGLARAKPSLTFTLNSGSNAPPIKVVTIALPRGLALDARRLTRGVLLGEAPPAKVIAQNDTLTITAGRPFSRMRVTLRYPALTVSSTLRQTLRQAQRKRKSQRPTKVSFSVTLTFTDPFQQRTRTRTTVTALLLGDRSKA